MTSNSSSEEDFVIACAVAEEEEHNMNRKRKPWIHNINLRREIYGEFHHLHGDLLKDERKFFQYYRMSPEKFTELVALLQPNIQRQHTKFRRAIGVDERLSVCLR